MKKLLYHIIYVSARLLSMLPFRVLYALSDFIYIIVYYIIGYRRKIVYKNLNASFPEKNPDEIKGIGRGFYHFFCDYMVETLKLMTISDKKLLDHIEFRNLDQVEEYFRRGQNGAGILGHYCNWEWLSAAGVAFTESKDAVVGLIYHPLRNEAFDRLMRDIRQSKGGVCVPKKDILRYLLRYRTEGRNSLFGYISDQTPKYENIHLWLPFLNQDTPVFTGAERIMKKMNDAVFYVDMQRPERGKYICTFKLITDKPQDCGEWEITKRFFAMLEDSIRRQPEFYLWSHNRWKRSFEKYEEKRHAR
ncbi:lysophospholipid acyltransferase family protein [Prevotella sp. PMUR]|uniref:Lysophospholipid acyltransferase family protein n=2 Tax=Xylanibacter muris TaxID=2736290 RepID=A0ABX2AL56_9BACT|nr:lysophospholipid acyltransferase family protein [Xylanibacter muris]NPD90944.1 lysophospholipid acyltransferase family protein [Xylanibacter muris]